MLQDKYKVIEDNETLCEEYMLDDAKYVLVGYGIVSRVLKTTVEKMRKENIPIGLFRPKTLFPFPKKQIAKLVPQAEKFMVVELSNGQMIEDIRLIVEGKKPVEFYNRMGGVVPSTNEIVEQVKTQLL